MKKENKLQIRNSTAEFLIFTRQAGEDGIEARVADETVWLTQKLIPLELGLRQTVDLRESIRRTIGWPFLGFSVFAC